MVAPLTSLRRAITGTKWYENYLEQKTLGSYHFDIQPISSGITSVNVTYDDGATHKIFAMNSIAEIKEQTNTIKRLRYSKANRSIWSLIQGCIALKHARSLLQKSELSLLTIGYGLDTYDAQFLLNNGYDVSFTNLDVADFKPWRTWSNLPKTCKAKYVQADARKLASVFPEEKFDIVLISRTSVELMPPDEFISVWNQGFDVLAAPGIMIGPIKGIEFSPVKADTIKDVFEEGTRTAEDTMVTYATEFGTFRIGGLSAPWYFPIGGRALGGFDVESHVADDLTRYAEASNLDSLTSLLADATDSHQFLESVLSEYGKYQQRLELDMFKGNPQIESVDYVESLYGANGFGMRSTLVATKI